MLSGAKENGTRGDVPLFRALARRWKSLAPVKRKRTQLASRLSADASTPTRAWISKPRQAAPVAPADKTARPAWNPWLWMK
jgi:hypothetical protein